jgi:hypothetical protein
MLVRAGVELFEAFDPMTRYADLCSGSGHPLAWTWVDTVDRQSVRHRQSFEVDVEVSVEVRAINSVDQPMPLASDLTSCSGAEIPKGSSIAVRRRLNPGRRPPSLFGHRVGDRPVDKEATTASGSAQPTIHSSQGASVRCIRTPLGVSP